MRFAAVLLIAWPASFALSRFAADLDFFWFAIILGCPLYALALWRRSAPLVAIILTQSLAHDLELYPSAVRHLPRRRVQDFALRIADVVKNRAKPFEVRDELQGVFSST